MCLCGTEDLGPCATLLSPEPLPSSGNLYRAAVQQIGRAELYSAGRKLSLAASLRTAACARFLDPTSKGTWQMQAAKIEWPPVIAPKATTTMRSGVHTLRFGIGRLVCERRWRACMMAGRSPKAARLSPSDTPHCPYCTGHYTDAAIVHRRSSLFARSWCTPRLLPFDCTEDTSHYYYTTNVN